MDSEILVNQSVGETRVARLDNKQLVEHYLERKKENNIIGNIFKGRVTRVLPGMQAAFVDIGQEKAGFLYVRNVVDPNRHINAEEELSDLDPEDNKSAETSETQTNNETGPDTPPISSLLTQGQEIMVQVVKDPIGTKGARLNGYISIPGRYLVYIPEGQQIGISRRIENEEEKKRLKALVKKNLPQKGGIIIRTVAEGATEKQLKDDLNYLLKIWGSIKKSFKKEKKIGPLYEDLDLALKILRDRATDEVSKVLVDNEQLYKKMLKFAQSYLPKFHKRIELFTEKTQIFEFFGVESELKRALSPKVWLKSGGSIVIDETEALTSIDVNTGRFVGKRNLEETILQTNMEALKEVAYQIRLRSLGGIIIIDFIDMSKEANRIQIYESFLEELKKDPVRTNVLPISSFGLIEMTRKRSRESLRQQMASHCPHCEGRGYLKSLESLACEVYRECEKEARFSKEGHHLILYCHPKLAQHLRENCSIQIEALEENLNRSLNIKIDPQLHIEDYEIFQRDN